MHLRPSLRFASIPPVAALALALLLSGCATTTQTAFATREPLNLSDAKVAVVAYADDGRYAADLAAISAEAKTWIVRRAGARQPDERLAVVMDIDETVLSNLPHMRTHDFGYIPPLFEAWVKSGDAPALPAVREVFATARANDVAVLFLTGRVAPAETEATAANLRREGMGDYAALVLKPAAAPRGQTALERKTAQRAAWSAEGWTIIATIGDQQSDLGAHAERSFKLPNPFYNIP
jgi:predicted secreted acid phosphatase